MGVIVQVLTNEGMKNINFLFNKKIIMINNLIIILGS